MKQKPVFYPGSYLIMTVSSLLLLGAVAGLGAILIDYWLNGVSGILTDSLLLYWLASVAVLLPVHLLAYWQVRHTDKSQVTTFSLRVAHGLLGVYLLAVVASSIVLGIWLAALWLNALLGTGQIDRGLVTASLVLAQAIGWLMYASRHFTASRTGQSRPKFYVVTVGSLGSLLLVLGLVFPAMAYRDVARDFVKENDLRSINRAVGDYVDARETLPKTLADLSGIPDETKHRLGEYQFAPHGNTKFGIFGYELCATFAKSKDKGRDDGFGFASHGAGKQCFVRTTISFSLLNQDLAQYVKNLEASVQDGEARLRAGIQNFLLSAKQAVDQEVAGVESFAGAQVKALETNLEGLEGGTTQLQQEMQRLEGNLGGLEDDTGDLAQDFAAVQKFLHDLGCLFGGC